MKNASIAHVERARDFMEHALRYGPIIYLKHYKFTVSIVVLRESPVWETGVLNGIADY
ncbi:MAG TPA: hypothetical protein PLV06_13835 [Bacteroidales bacterium]|nr:hypothetical protein [Bacteroidales bacterium]HPJ60302.1 hypothetical protein [Bacteroidales bacterium]HPR13464.1 hypothetical protein [Bacteroidales bacterium]HRW86272.1 hypothetical protein [Bacteroidales bacterium]